MNSKVIYLLIFISQIIASNFLIKDQTGITTTVAFNLGSYSIEEINDYSHIISVAKRKTENYGEPEFPTFSFNFAIDNSKNYNIEYNVLEYSLHENVDLYPSQPLLDNNSSFMKNESLYASSDRYIFENIRYNRQSLRGYELLGISFIPFEYNFDTKELKVYTNVDINIIENGYNNNNEMPRSKVFEDMYKNIIINDESFSDYRNFQYSSILYIYGENADYNILEPLIEWRRQQGYIVNAVSTDETGESTTSIKNYISNAYYNWADPPEFVCLVGDDGNNPNIEINTYWVTGSSGQWNSAEGEGDHPYSLLDGDDLLSDVILGRISVRSNTELFTVISKIIGYEKNYSNNTQWQDRAVLVGDTDPSGISTIITNQYINTLFDIHGGITDVRTKYGNGDNSWDNWMRDQIDDGVAYLNYRGIAGFSGFSDNDVNNLDNGTKLPFITTLTCDTGSFATQSSCIVESLFRAGTSASPKGAVAAIGVAQIYTHTLFNNIVDMGIYDGLFLYNATTAGEALLYGKLALNEIYPENPNDNVYLFSVWNNLIGDPATQLWTSSLKQLNVSHNEIFIHGSNNFQVLVEDTLGNTMPNAIVTLYKTNNNQIELQVSQYTDNNGIADFILGDYNEGNVIVTTRCQNCVPIETGFNFSDDLPEILINENSLTIEELIGNNNGNLNPSETVELLFSIENISSEEVNNLYVDLSTLSEYITILNDNIFVGDLSPLSSKDISGITISLSSDVPDLEDIKLRLTLSSDNIEWNYELPITVYSGNILLESSIINDNNNNGLLDRGETATLNISLNNHGAINLENITAEIDFSQVILQLSSSNLNFPNAGVGELVQSIEELEVSASYNLPNGLVTSIPIEIVSENGFSSSEIIQIQVGEVSVTDPLGPDMYGYFIYDQSDNYELAPTYNWIEIDPDMGGVGQILSGIYDNGDNSDDVTTIDLPFDFTFYGIEYDKVSICSNGWISFGETDMQSFRNYTLPGPGGPPQMVAVFWDDLTTINGIITHYDQFNDSFIIEWSEVETYYANSVESFQIILYNTDSQTATGDDEMKLQYKEFNNTTTGFYPVGNWNGTPVHGQYCTVGIENHLSNDGLQYTFNNIYPEPAMPLYDGTALFITTGNLNLYDDMILGDINQDQIIDVLDIVQLVNIVLDLTNPSTMESILADINEDNIINIQDIIILVNLVLSS